MRLMAAVFLGWLPAPGLPVPPAAAQETPLLTLRASAEPIITIGPGQGVDSPYELFRWTERCGFPTAVSWWWSEATMRYADSGRTALICGVVGVTAKARGNLTVL